MLGSLVSAMKLFMGCRKSFSFSLAPAVYHIHDAIRLCQESTPRTPHHPSNTRHCWFNDGSTIIQHCLDVTYLLCTFNEDDT